MRIAAVAGSRVPSDTANSIQVMKACQALVQLGHDLTLIVPGPRPSGDDLEQVYGLQTLFPVIWLPAGGRRLFTWQAVRRARELKPDLLYVWMVQSAVFGLLAHLPVIFEIHIHPSGLLGPVWHRWFGRLSGRKRLASITQALVGLLQQRYGVHLRPEDFVVAPNGVDLERFGSLPDASTARRRLNLPEAFTAACTGHLYSGRGADLFLDLAQAVPSIRFLWVGGRPQDVGLWRGRAEKRGLQNVTFTGFIPNRDLPLYQAAADVLLMPYGRSILGSSGSADSAAIASPMKMFEYMATGRAILTSDLPVIREVLNDSNAVFCQPDNLPDWQAALEKLRLEDPTRARLAQQAKRDAENHTWLSRARRILEGF